MCTPDGRRGWLDIFLGLGYAVYITDVPARGRSAYHPEADGPLNYKSADHSKKYLADASGPWPSSSSHTQWPSSPDKDGRGYDRHYDSFCSAQVESLPPSRQQELVRDAGAALLDKTGPAVLLTHSMAGPYGWLIADQRPELVKAIVSIEPSGPPFAGISISTGKQRPYGIADIHLRYEPAMQTPKWRQEDTIHPPPADDIASWMQPEPAGQLVNLKNIPVIIISAEASYHSSFDHLTAAFLKQAGVSVEFAPLAEHGIHGNGHMMMLEENNDVIAEFIHQWISNHINAATHF
jgi:pimeloyl-ACP methyl ester carboxylesterase